MEASKRFQVSPLSILNVANFLQYQRFVMPISFLFYLQNGLTFSDFILCQSIYNITCLVGKFATGFIGDIFSKKHILIAAYLLFMTRVILWINFEGFWIVLAGEILYGLFKALYQGNLDGYMYEYLKENNKHSEMINKYGKFAFCTSLSSAISCFAGGLLYKCFGFKIILLIELITQITAVICLFILPNTKPKCEHLSKPKEYVKNITDGIKSVFSNIKVNYYVYYSAMLTGFTSVFVWNFQPLLKLSSAPIIFYVLINFVNQLFRAIGGLSAKKVMDKYKNKLIYIDYLAIILSFILLIFCYYSQNYILVFISLLLICTAILLLFVFNIFNISNLHKHTQDSNRATCASVNVFAENFVSFFLLLNFKFLYDKFGIITTLLTYMTFAILVLIPSFEKKHRDSDVIV